MAISGRSRRRPVVFLKNLVDAAGKIVESPVDEHPKQSLVASARHHFEAESLHGKGGAPLVAQAGPHLLELFQRQEQCRNRHYSQAWMGVLFEHAGGFRSKPDDLQAIAAKRDPFL